MTERVFVDTNLLVYAFDNAEPAKRARALAILDRSASEYREATPVVSTQVLQEFYVTVVQKLDQPMSDEMAAEAVERLVLVPSILLTVVSLRLIGQERELAAQRSTEQRARWARPRPSKPIVALKWEPADRLRGEMRASTSPPLRRRDRRCAPSRRGAPPGSPR